MLISHSHKFVFVHIPKTAGTSITQLLEPYCAKAPDIRSRRIARKLGLRQDPNNAHFRSHDTAAHAQFVATVTGTAGWEAIRKGRPALVFGNAWYKSLPGVHLYGPDVDFEAIAASTFEHAALEQAAGALLDRCHPGVIEPIYLSNASDFDGKRNLLDVAKTTLGLLTGTVPLTYGGADDL